MTTAIRRRPFPGLPPVGLPRTRGRPPRSRLLVPAPACEKSVGVRTNQLPVVDLVCKYTSQIGVGAVLAPSERWGQNSRQIEGSSHSRKGVSVLVIFYGRQLFFHLGGGRLGKTGPESALSRAHPRPILPCVSNRVLVSRQAHVSMVCSLLCLLAGCGNNTAPHHARRTGLAGSAWNVSARASTFSSRPAIIMSVLTFENRPSVVAGQK